MWLSKDHRIRTYTGKLVNPFNLKIEDICLEDGAHSLSLQTRFTGHTTVHLPIATHSLLVAYLCPEGFRLDGLCHDFSETYRNDIASPIKSHWTMWFYKRGEKKSQRVISQALGVRYPIPEEVHRADKTALQIEQYLFMIKENNERYPLPDTLYGDHHEHYGIKFMRKLLELSIKQIEQLFIDSYFLYKNIEGLEWLA